MYSKFFFFGSIHLYHFIRVKKSTQQLYTIKKKIHLTCLSI